MFAGQEGVNDSESVKLYEGGDMGETTLDTGYNYGGVR